LIKALSESLSKYGFGGFQNESDVIDFLEKMSCSNEDTESNIEKISTCVKTYLEKNMSNFTKTEKELNNEYDIYRVKQSGDFEEIKIICDKQYFAKGSYNEIYHGTLKTGIENYMVDTKVVVKVCTFPDNIEDNFTELFIHAILSIYQRRFLQNQYNNNLITPFILTSYNKDIHEFVTILEYVHGDISGLLKSPSMSYETKKTIIDEVIFYQSCGLIPLQKDLKFIHGDNHTGNVFNIFNYGDNTFKYFFADFGFTRIEINSNLLCAGYCKGFQSKESCSYYSSRKDLMQLIYYMWKYFFPSYDLFNIPVIYMSRVEYYIFNIDPKNKYYSIYYPNIYTREGYENINNIIYTFFDPHEMLKILQIMKPEKFNNALCQKMIGPKWTTYLADDGGGAVPPSLTGGYAMYKKKYLKYKMKYTMLKNR
jgi:hypothetical protein